MIDPTAQQCWHHAKLSQATPTTSSAQRLHTSCRQQHNYQPISRQMQQQLQLQVKYCMALGTLQQCPTLLPSNSGKESPAATSAVRVPAAAGGGVCCCSSEDMVTYHLQKLCQVQYQNPNCLMQASTIAKPTGYLTSHGQQLVSSS